MASGEEEELGPDPELLERDLRHHREASTGGVTLPETGRFGEGLDEALGPDLEAHLGQLGVGAGGGSGQVEGGGEKERIIDVPEGVERDAVLGQNSEEEIGRVVDDGRGKEAARGGDEGCGGAVSALGGDEAVVEDGAGREGDVGGGIGMDVNIVKIGVGFGEEKGPEGGEVEVRVGEEEEGDLGFGGFRIKGEVGECRLGFSRVRVEGAVEEGLVVELVGGGDGDLRAGRGEEAWGEEEEEGEGEEEEEGDEEWGGGEHLMGGACQGGGGGGGGSGWGG